jgi:short-subunit dehydrogenase involved in D-alanine esterification of teichoic acids
LLSKILTLGYDLGKALAQEYARLGAKVIISARREAELEQVKASLKGD